MLLILAVCNTSKVNAQAAFEKGKSYASLGYGLTLFKAAKLLTITANELGMKSNYFGPLLIKYEYAVSDKIGIGMSFGYTTVGVSATDDSNYTYKFKYNKLTATPRVNFHLGGENEKLDPYIGFGLGYKKVSYSLTTNNPDVPQIKIPGFPSSFEASVGCRYIFTPNVGAFIEVGAGHGYTQFGLVAKF